MDQDLKFTSSQDKLVSPYHGSSAGLVIVSDVTRIILMEILVKYEEIVAILFVFTYDAKKNYLFTTATFH